MSKYRILIVNISEKIIKNFSILYIKYYLRDNVYINIIIIYLLFLKNNIQVNYEIDICYYCNFVI